MNSSQHAAGQVLSHGMRFHRPLIEITDNAHPFGVRRPHGEVHPFGAIDLAQLGTEAIVAIPVIPFAK